tara:strand:- start:241 stop:834 length:594 start_codon:yes stop_codon:yes gene_type:complete
MMSFNVGDSVRVKPDITFEGVNIGGWQGRVHSTHEEWVMIDWDSVTLGTMPMSYIRESYEEVCYWDSFQIKEGDIERAVERDTREDVEGVLKGYKSAIGRWGLDGLTAAESVAVAAPIATMLERFVSLHLQKDSAQGGSQDFRRAIKELVQISALTRELGDEMEILSDLLNCEIEIEDYQKAREKKGLIKGDSAGVK